MKKIFFFMLSAFLLAPLSSFAFQSQANETITITSPITQDYYAVGWEITISSSAAHDLTVLGGKNFINSTIWQDLTVAGGDVVINGSVGESAKIAWGTIIINSTIQKDLFVWGGDITLSRTASIAWDTFIWADLLKLEGTLNNANLNASQIIFGWNIKGNAVIRAEKIQVATWAKILWNLEYYATEKNIALEQIVSGTIDFKQLPVKTWMHFFLNILTWYLVFWFLFLSVFGILFFYVGKDRFTTPLKVFKDSPWSCLWYGFLVYAVIPFTIMLLMMSFIGIPFWLLLIAIYVCLFAFYKLCNVIFYSHLLVDKLWWVKNTPTRKIIWIILLSALLSALVATIDIVLAFFALWATLKSVWGKHNK